MTPNFDISAANSSVALQLQGISEAWLASYGSITTPDANDLKVAGIIVQPVCRPGARLEDFEKALAAVQTRAAELKAAGKGAAEMAADESLKTLRESLNRVAIAAQFLVFEGHPHDAIRLPVLRPKPLTFYKVGLQGATFTRQKVNGDAWTALDAWRQGKTNGDIADKGVTDCPLKGKTVALRTIYKVNVNNRDGVAAALFTLVIAEGKTPAQLETALADGTRVE